MLILHFCDALGYTVCISVFVFVYWLVLAFLVSCARVWMACRGLVATMSVKNLNHIALHLLWLNIMLACLSLPGVPPNHSIYQNFKIKMSAILQTNKFDISAIT